MAYYLSNERNRDVAEAYQRYQQYLRQNEHEFPPNAFALAIAEWYQDAGDHRCPHDGWLENLTISEMSKSEKGRGTTIRVRLLAAYHDGHIEFFYRRVFSYLFEGPSCTGGLGDWLYDEFRLSPNGNLIHEIEWSGLPNGQAARWVIEASDVEFQWIPTLVK